MKGSSSKRAKSPPSGSYTSNGPLSAKKLARTYANRSGKLAGKQISSQSSKGVPSKRGTVKALGNAPRDAKILRRTLGK